MQNKLTTQSKREQKVTKWSVQIVENVVGRAGFGELPTTLCKEVPEEITEYGGPKTVVSRGDEREEEEEVGEGGENVETGVGVGKRCR